MTIASAPTGLHLWRVLIIDDSSEDRSEVRRLLLKGSERRYQFVEAETGAAGVRAVLNAGDPLDCVVLDFNLPDMDANEVLAALAGPEGATICPVVVLTGTVGHEPTRAVLRAGAQDYLGKGWMSPESLTRAVENAAERWVMARELRDRDVTLRKASQQMNMAMAAADAGSWQMNLTTGEFSASARAIELHGLPPGTPLSHERVLACAHPDDRASLDAALRLTFESGTPFRHEHRVPRADGSVRWVASHAERSDEGGQTCVIGLVQDVTERKRTEQALTERTELLNGVLEGTTDVIFAKDLNGRLLMVNAACAAVLSSTPEQVVGKTADALYPPDVAAAIRHHDERVLAAELPIQLEESLLVAGERRSFLTLKAPLRDGGGRVVGLLGISRDVSEWKRAEEVLRASEERFRRAADAVKGIIYEYDFTTGHVERTSGLYEVVGYRPDEVPATAAWWREQTHPDDRETNDRLYSSLVGDAVVNEYRLLHKDGRWLHVEDRAVLQRGDDGRLVKMVGCTVDVTGRKKAEVELRATEHRIRLATEATQVGIWEWNTFTNVVRWDAQMFRIHGITPTPDGFVGYSDWSGAVLPEDLAETEAILQETVRRCGSSTRTFRIRRSADGECRHIAATETARRNDHGQAEWVVGTNLDITERHRTEDELRRLAADLSEADRRKNVFLATLAHELRNPLAPISAGLEVLRLSGSDAKVEQVRAIMARQVSQLVRLVDDLLDVSRISEGKVELRKERVELRAVFDAAVETSRPAIEQGGHELAVVLPDEPISVEGDAVRLTQVVSNLLNNSAKFTHRGGHIRLTAGREGGMVVVAVKDDGIGIPPSMLDTVFVMFTQVGRPLEKSAGGLGIGLSLVKELVELHGGTIVARSGGEGMGSEFVVRLPVVTAVVAGPDRSNGQSSEVVPPTLRRILVVDDNVDAADMLREVLELLGNEVRAANDGEAGIAMAAQFLPDVMVMDIGMPNLSGYEAARRIREYPWGQGIVLIALTGWGREDDRKKSSAAGFDHHLVKPLDVGVLRKLLAELKTATPERG
ncbi:MAG: PAS domain S-box protein [Myxococcales bacterium]|nr:PAS domain S-box protein [Myxococcales bacterium]MDP3502312.1 PAS domain S-box protein [Myxococcales bacterium]